MTIHSFKSGEPGYSQGVKIEGLANTSHNHGSEKWIPAIVVTFSKTAPFHFHDYGRVRVTNTSYYIKRIEFIRWKQNFSTKGGVCFDSMAFETNIPPQQAIIRPGYIWGKLHVNYHKSNPPCIRKSGWVFCIFSNPPPQIFSKNAIFFRGNFPSRHYLFGELSSYRKSPPFYGNVRSSLVLLPFCWRAFPWKNTYVVQIQQSIYRSTIQHVYVYKKIHTQNICICIIQISKDKCIYIHL